jgi:hypothetical protein
MTNLALGPTYKKTTKNSEFSDACVPSTTVQNTYLLSKKCPRNLY